MRAWCRFAAFRNRLIRDELGVALALASALCFGLYLVLSRKWGMSHGLDGTAIAVANRFARFAICGMISQYNATEPSPAPRGPPHSRRTR